MDQILPSIQSLGVLGYWVIFAAALLEAFFVTGIVVPGTLIVDAGGILVHRGLLDFFDLVWFVAIGSILGGEASYWTGRLARSRLDENSRFMRSRAYARAQSLLARHGGLALVLGRFSGPVAGLVPLVAALAGINRRTFLIWNIAASIPYAFAHVALGYLIGGAIGHISGTVTRLALILGTLALTLVLVWWLLLRLFRLMPIMLSLAEALLRHLAALPIISRWISAHPLTVRWLSARFDKSSFAGLPLTCLTLVFGYVLAVWVEVTLEFVFAAPFVAVDSNVANLAHVFWSPDVLRAAAYVTALGDARVIAALLLAALLWLLPERRRALMIGLTTAVLGNVLSVVVLKSIFARPRPDLAYFVETTGSFPSGHAAIAIAFYGTLAYVLWRSGRLGQVSAVMAASIFVFAIGASRLILIEHFLTDVLNGWLIGGLWLLVGVTLTEWRIARSGQTRAASPSKASRTASLTGIAVLLGLALWQVATYEKALSVRPDIQSDRSIATPAAILSDPDFIGYSETLTGETRAPINLVIGARDTAVLATLMTATGWTASEAPSPGHLIDLAYALAHDRSAPSALVLPLFWSGKTNALAMRNAASGDGATVARVWMTRFVTADGLRVFVASVGPDILASEDTPPTQAFTQARDRLLDSLNNARQGTLSITPAGGDGIAVVVVRSDPG